MKKHNFGDMACVKNALYDAGIDAAGLPNHGLHNEALPYIAEHYGIQYHNNGNVVLKDKPIIAVYKTEAETGHCEYHESPSELKTNKLLGLFTFRGKRGD